MSKMTIGMDAGVLNRPIFARGYEAHQLDNKYRWWWQSNVIPPYGRRFVG